MNQIVYVGKHSLTMQVSRHSHSSWELIYCTSGAGELLFDGLTLPYGKDSVAVIPPFVPHSNRSREGFTNIHLNLTETTLTETAPLVVPADQTGFLLDAFQAAFYYYSRISPDRAVLLPLYGQLIGAFVSTRQPEAPHNSIVREIENSILQNYPDASYDLNAFLHALPFNCEYVKKLFKKETGLTPLQYLTEKRLDSAAQALAINSGKVSVAETARLCGFSEPLYFSRLFKKRYGVSPRQYEPEESSSVSADSVKITL